ncbi:MAG: MFS transporter [Spirochaetales bacterium]|nr:MFS transporter [Spirochaetales bacterium]
MGELKLSTKIGYGMGDLAGNLLFQMTVIYLLFFYTDVLGISAMAAGFIFLVARLWDAVNDPVMGLLMDRTRSKHGKARVYLLYGSLPLGLATVAMFYAPDLPMGGKVAYAAGTYILWGMLFTLVNIPYSSLTASLTDIPQERTDLSSIRMIFMLIGVIIVSVATEPLVSSFATPSRGYFSVTAIFSLLALFFFLLCFRLTGKAASESRKKDESYKLGEIWPLLLKNRQLLIVTAASLIGNMAVFIRETSAIYYVTYNMGDSAMLPLFLGIVVLSMVAANLMIPLATKKWDKKGTYLIGSAIGVAGSVVFHFIPYDQTALIFLFGALSSFGIAAISTVGWAMIPDTIEYGELVTGKRAEGISYAVYSFSQKLATAVAGITVASILQWSGYAANIPVQSDQTLRGILSTLTVIPVVFIVLSMAIIRFYAIDRTTYEGILLKLKEKMS